MLKNLKKLRTEKGISQQKLADIIMVSQQSINKYENQSCEPDINTMIRIAEYFDVTLDYLVGRSTIRKYSQANEGLSDNPPHFSNLHPDIPKDIYEIKQMLRGISNELHNTNDNKNDK